MLPNSVFNHFPVEFKQITKEDFNVDKINPFQVNDKIVLEPDTNGYIYESIKDKICLIEKGTVVINAPVGCGKSYSILKLIQKIYNEEPNSKIIVAPPFVSLIQQYCFDVNRIAGIPIYDIYDYSDLGRHPKVPYKNKRVHVVTANTLLGNPGEDGFKNSEAKREYLREIINECQRLSQKVFFIYDEIHDSIANFKEEFIFNLWNWGDLVHMNILISATYNEASKVVIKYLAELTDKKITIIESPRKIIPEKQSKLHLHYCSDFNFTVTTNKIVSVIDNLLDRGKNIDILCYSKTLSKSIIKDKTGIGKKLADRFGSINDCTSELVSNQRGPNEPPKNRYDNDACNVGTNFKTGVNIVKENHAYVIILPPRATRLTFRNMSGIFSDGVVGIIQAIARQRKKGEIHIILPKPDRFNYSSLGLAQMTPAQQNTFQDSYSQIQQYNDEVTPVNYLPLNTQEQLLHNFYHDILLKDLKPSITRCKSKEERGDRLGLPRLTFPPYEIFKLNTGEDYLANNFKFFGEDLSAYVTYCAFTNQFMNCKLMYLNSKDSMFFEEGKIQEGLIKNFLQHFGEEYYESVITYSNFALFYRNIRNNFFENYSLMLKTVEDEKLTLIKPYKSTEFELQLLKFCLKIYQNGSELSPLYHSKEEVYSRHEYLLDCISYSEKNPKENKLTKSYNFLGILRRRLIENMSKGKNGTSYLPMNPPDSFIKATEMEKLFSSLETIIREDPFIKNDVFTFRRNLTKKDSSKQLLTLYKVLLEDLFETENSKVQVSNKRVNVKLIKRVIPLPNSKISPIMTANLDGNYLDALSEVVFQVKDENGNQKFETLDQYFEDTTKTFRQLE